MHSPQRAETLGGLPPGGVGLRVDEYLEFVRKEYLADFIRRGGAAVKLAVTGDDEVAARLHAGLAAAATAEGYLFAAVDAAATRVHLIDQLFFAVASQVDWGALAGRAVRLAYQRADFPVGAAPGEAALRIADVAEVHDIDPGELHRSVRRSLENALLGDPALVREFGRAVFRLGQHLLDRGDVSDPERDAVLAWLRGDKVPLVALRSALIYARIGRHNARAMLTSLARLLPQVGVPGLLLDLDLARLAVARRPLLEQREGVYYSKAAVLDAYEVLRQLIDATDTMSSIFVLAALPPDLLTDEARGVAAYSALQLRVADEVRDRRRANPYAALARLETRMEVVP